jgi:adenylate kinase family enzyme
MRRNIIVTGIPASGKSTVGSIISTSTHLPLLDKDDILESLFDTRGVGDRDWRTQLSREADRLLREQAIDSNGAIIVSWWRHPRSTRNSGTAVEWLSELDGILIEVYCVCDPLVAATRFHERRRHPGHLDQTKQIADLFADFAEHAQLGPLGLGQLIKVDTERNIDDQSLYSEIENLCRK